jgi:hypothetical protein
LLPARSAAESEETETLKLVPRLLLLPFLALPAMAQYGGPAILSRGEAPSAMSSPQIDFRPFVGIYGTYDTGLSSVAVTDVGGLANADSYGVTLNWGVSGTHSWRHTKVGLDYLGSLTHYTQKTSYDSVDQSFLLGFSHQLSRHILFSIRNNVGFTNRDQRLRGLDQTVPFDPATTYAPATDFFDNRTIYVSSQADLVYQKSSRLSFDFGGDGFTTRRRSKALYGVTGAAARADMEYRVSRRTTLGFGYSYGHYDFTRIFGGTDLHGAALNYAVQISRHVDFTGYVGVYRVESKFEEVVPVDPVIASLLGIGGGSRVVHNINYTPNVAARLSRTFSRGVLYVSGGRSVTPGNGLFLTSIETTGLVGYTFTGVRRWSFAATTFYSRGNSLGNIQGPYSMIAGSLTGSRSLGKSLHIVVDYTARQYGSTVYDKYNRLIHSAAIGLAFAPGEVPLRVW